MSLGQRWNLWNDFATEALKPIFDAATANGLNLWDTANADEAVLNEKGKIDDHTFKPVLFEFPTYEYFVTRDKAGDYGRMNA